MYNLPNNLFNLYYRLFVIYFAKFNYIFVYFYLTKNVLKFKILYFDIF